VPAARLLTCATVTSIETADGCRIAFEETGAGPDLVLVHGITESRRAWDPVLPLLAEQWRVIAVDLRGHGESSRRAPYDPESLAADLGAVVAELALDAPLVVGHSLGGVVVSAYAGARFPVRGVVNVDQPLRLASFQEALAPLTPMLRGDDAAFREAVGIVFTVLDGELPPGERARLDALSSPEQDVVLEIWGPVLDAAPGTLDDQVAALLRGISVPYLAIHGSDPGPEYAQWLLGLVDDARLEVWPGVGHYPQLVDPERFAERLDQFEGQL
jgi:pimeloyl-ACP methyl ester carboxylesterase